MYAKHKDLEATATFSTYYIGSGQYETMIGRIYTIMLDRGNAYVLEVHDWDSDTNAYLDGEGDGYDGLIVDTYMDKAEAEAEMERRARAASVPEPLPGERPATHVFADLIDDVTGEQTASVEHGDGDRLNARVEVENLTAAVRLTAKLKSALPYASVRWTGAVVKLWTTEADLRKALRR